MSRLIPASKLASDDPIAWRTISIFWQLNIVNGFGLETGKPLASSSRIAQIAFMGETTTGRLIMQYASQNLIPVTLEPGGKSPNIFFKDVVADNDDFFDKAIEGFVMFALNQGEVCTCPSRALIHESIYDQFMERALKRVKAIVQGDPLDPAPWSAHRRPAAARKNPVLFRHRSTGTCAAPVYISGSQYDVWKHTNLIIDAVPGRGGMFSLDNGREVRFLTRSTV